MKKGARFLGVDDASFSLEDEHATVTGVVYRGTEFVEDIRFSEVEVDGDDATETVRELHSSCNNPRQIQAVLVDGLCLAGFNLVRINELAEEMEKPVLAVTSNEPSREKFRATMEKSGKSCGSLSEVPEAEEIQLEDGKIYVQACGISMDEAEQLLRSLCINGTVPEPVRLAHLIGARLDEAK